MACRGADKISNEMTRRQPVSPVGGAQPTAETQSSMTAMPYPYLVRCFQLSVSGRLSRVLAPKLFV